MAGKLAKTRPGGRTERNRTAVAEAVLSFVRQGRLDFEIQEISAVSGVHRTTISRRWPDRGALMAEAMAEHVARLSVQMSGDWEEDIRRITRELWRFFLEPTELNMNRMLALSDNQAFHEKMYEYWNPIFSHFQEQVRKGKEAGMVKPGVDEELLVWMISSVLLMFSALARIDPDPHLPDRLAEQIIYLCRPR